MDEMEKFIQDISGKSLDMSNIDLIKLWMKEQRKINMDLHNRLKILEGKH